MADLYEFEDASMARMCEIVQLIDLQAPEAIMCWDGLDAPEVRPRPFALIVAVLLVALAAALSATVLH